MIKKKSLSKRYEVSYRNKEVDNTTKKNVLDLSKVGGDVKFFTPVEGRNRINIIPYTIKSKNHPLVAKEQFEIGDPDYLLDLYVHRNVGASESSVVCLKHTYGKPCPICEEMARLRKEGREQEADMLKPSRRVFYNVQDLKEPEDVKIFETSHYLFEKELIDESRNDGGGFVDFADVDDGKEIRFRANETTKGSIKFKEFKSFSFVDREEPISEEILNKAISFDEIINVLSYDEIKNVLYNTTNDTEDSIEEEEEIVDEDDVDVKHKKVEKEEEEKVEEDVKHKKVEKATGKNKCPFGHNFGADCDCHKECDDCDMWESCCKE